MKIWRGSTILANRFGTTGILEASIGGRRRLQELRWDLQILQNNLQDSNQYPKWPTKTLGPRVYTYTAMVRPYQSSHFQLRVLGLTNSGETEWTINGRYTGTSEIPLTASGRSQVAASSSVLIGAGRLISPSKLAKIYISPRIRAKETFEIAFDKVKSELPQEKVKFGEERLAEWNYGAYEGLVTKEIRALRKEHGLDTERPWDIWVDGCEEGESAAEVTARLDSLIAEIRAMQAPYMRGEKPVDVVLVAHGHLLRAFVKRWLGYDMGFPLSMMLEPGGVGVLSYQHKNVEEPAVLVGIGFPVAQ